MTVDLIIFSILLVLAILGAILFVAFGQITVRKLRKIPELKSGLGLELVSGMDILNTAQALTLPASISKKFKKSPLSFLYADKELLVNHTNKFDRTLARVFYLVYVITAMGLLLYTAAHTFSVN